MNFYIVEKTDEEMISPMLWRLVRAVELHLEREEIPLDILVGVGDVKCDLDGSITLRFMNNRNPIHMYISKDGEHHYVRANTFERCLSMILLEIYELNYEPIDNSISSDEDFDDTNPFQNRSPSSILDFDRLF